MFGQSAKILNSSLENEFLTVILVSFDFCVETILTANKLIYNL